MDIWVLYNMHNKTRKGTANFGLNRGCKEREARPFRAFSRAKPCFTGDFPEKKEKSFEFLRNSSCQTGEWVV